MTDTDSVLYQISKVTKYIHGSGRLEKEVMEKLFSANSSINSRLDSHNFHNSDRKKELLRFGFEVVPPRTVEKFIGRASKQCVMQTNDSEISKHKVIKKCLVVFMKDYQEHLLNITKEQQRKKPEKEIRTYEQYKLVKNNRNEWFLTRQYRKFGFLSDKPITLGCYGLSQIR